MRCFGDLADSTQPTRFAPRGWGVRELPLSGPEVNGAGYSVEPHLGRWVPWLCRAPLFPRSVPSHVGLCTEGWKLCLGEAAGKGSAFVLRKSEDPGLHGASGCEWCEAEPWAAKLTAKQDGESASLATSPDEGEGPLPMLFQVASLWLHRQPIGHWKEYVSYSACGGGKGGCFVLSSFSHRGCMTQHCAGWPSWKVAGGSAPYKPVALPKCAQGCEP